MGKKFSVIAIAVAGLGLSFGFAPRAKSDVGELPPAAETQPHYNYAPPRVYYPPPPPPVQIVVYPGLPLFAPFFGFGYHHHNHYWDGRRVYHRPYHWR